MYYSDRAHAGVVLADALQRADPAAATSSLVLGVPRGGVIVAAALANRLGLALDVALARKLGAPFNRELAVGAVAEDGTMWLNDDLLRRLGGRGQWLDEAIAAASDELARRSRRYRTGAAPAMEGRIVTVVDDGVATGATLAAVLRTVRARRPARLVCAVPVAPPEGVAMLADLCDTVVCPQQPRRFGAVGQWYDDFHQNSDEEVIDALAGAERPDVAPGSDR